MENSSERPCRVLGSIDILLFQRTFEQVSSRLPVVFQTFWHRWAIDPANPTALMVYDDSGRATLRIEHASNGYRIYGLSERGDRLYAERQPTIEAVLRACGLF